MSSRTLRKLYGNRSEDVKEEKKVVGDCQEEEEEEEEGEIADVELNVVNKFSLLLGDDDNDVENDDSASEKEDEGAKVVHKKTPVAGRANKKRKKKKSKKKNVTCDSVDYDLFVGLSELNSESQVSEASKVKSGKKKPKTQRSVLEVQHRSLNTYNELQKIFGSEVLRGDTEYRRRTKVNSTYKGGVWITQPDEEWTRGGRIGLNMSVVEEKKSGTTYFKFEHSKEYQETQFEFLDAVNSSDAGNLQNLLQRRQPHIDSLIAYSEFCKLNDNLKLAREFIERALYYLEKSMHPLFNLTTGKCCLEYKYEENRAFFLCLFKHLHYVSRRGCNRTALELTKLLYSFDPENDPLASVLLLDQFALNSGEYTFITRSVVEWGASKNLLLLPNWAFSNALATYHLAVEAKSDNTVTADELLQDALLRFPMVLLKLLEKCSVQPDKKVVDSDYFTGHAESSTSQGLELLCHMYIERCHTSWKEPNALAWLEAGVNNVLEITEKKEDNRIKTYAKMRRRRYQKTPLNISRHALISELPGVRSFLPVDIRLTTIVNHNPLPPPDSVTSYSRPERLDRRLQGNPLSLFFNSMLPGYDIEVEREAGASQTNREAMRSNATMLMNAMRELLVHTPNANNNDADEDEEVPFQDEWD